MSDPQMSLAPPSPARSGLHGPKLRPAHGSRHPMWRINTDVARSLPVIAERTPLDVIPELLVYTLGFLWHEPESLKACSLVCRPMRPTAQYYLFRRIQLSSADACKRFHAVLDVNPALTKHVREFVLRSDPADPSIDWIPEALTTIGSRLTHVEHLKLDPGSLRNGFMLDQPAVDALCAHFPLVRKFSMLGSCFRTPECFYTVLAAFKDVVWLDLPVLPWRPLTSLEHSLPLHFHLLKLKINPCYEPTQRLLAQLEEGGNVNKLDTITLSSAFRKEDAPWLNQFLAARGDKLHRLAVAAPGTAPTYGQPDFKHNKRVAHLLLEGIRIRGRPRNRTPPTWVTDTLANFDPSTSLHEVTLLIDHSGPEALPLEDLNWSAIAVALNPASAPLARHLRRVNVVLLSLPSAADSAQRERHACEAVELASRIEDSLPHLSILGMLRVIPSVPSGGEVMWRLRDGKF